MNFRRFPHLRPVAGELDPLELLQALPPGAAQELERLLKRQHVADASFTRHQRSSTQGIDEALDGRLARAVATGGGRRRHPRGQLAH